MKCSLNKKLCGLLAVGWLLFASIGVVSAASVHEACKADINHYCDTVTIGNGRLMACLYAHEDKISEDCDDATDDVLAILDTVLARVVDVQSQCISEINKLCSDVKYGEGRILTCLKDNISSLTDDCKKAMPPIAEGLGE